MKTNAPFRLGWLLILALFASGCQRVLVTLTTPTPAGGDGSPAAERSAIIESTSGTVEWRTSASGAWQPAGVGQVLDVGAEVRTGDGSEAALRLTEGSKIYLAPNTEFAFRLLNPFLDSHLTALTLRQGLVWVVLTSGALDVETPLGVATARGASLSAEVGPGDRVNLSCLEGVCGFGSILIPERYVLNDAANNEDPQPMSFGDLTAWGENVPEATEIAQIGTEAAAQGSNTPPILPTATQTPTEPPTATPTNTPPPTETVEPTATDTTAPDEPTNTPVTPTETPPPTQTPEPTFTPVPSPTLPTFRPTVTPIPFTPIPAAPVIGQHVVLSGETIFCIGRGYGVLPGAIAQANNLPATYNVRTGQVLNIPEVQWVNISPGPVCAPQFASPFPGLPVPTATNPATSTPAGPPLALKLEWNCIGNCDINQGDYVVHIVATATGGVGPYTFSPAEVFDVTIPHCTNGQGTVTVVSADGQTASASWFYDDVSCPD